MIQFAQAPDQGDLLDRDVGLARSQRARLDLDLAGVEALAPLCRLLLELRLELLELLAELAQALLGVGDVATLARDATGAADGGGRAPDGSGTHGLAPEQRAEQRRPDADRA